MSTQTDKIVRDLTIAYIQARTSSAATRATYLQTLVAETQRELGMEPRANNAKRPKLNDETRAKQLAAVATVHARFYAIVTEVAEESLTDVSSKDHARELNARTNFARTALYAVRLYIRADRDITGVAPGKASKSSLAVPVVGKPTTPRRLKNRVERASKAFVTALLALGEQDQATARAELDTLLGIMANQLAALGAPLARDAKHAAAEHRPFRQGSTVFVPTQTTILRQQSNPS